MEDLKPLIDAVVQVVKNSSNFVSYQSPEIVRQFIVKGYCDDGGWAVFSLIVLLAVILWTLHIYHSDGDEKGSLIFINIFIGFIAILGLVANLEDILTIYLAPQAWLISSLMELRKN